MQAQHASGIMAASLTIRPSVLQSLSVPRARHALERCHHVAGGGGEQYRCRTMMRRSFAAVKELPWCEPKNTDRQQPAALYRRAKNIINEVNTVYTPISRFGVIAAMARDTRVLGVDGQLPWPALRQDRQHFVHVTRDKILVMGRRTLQERPSLSHIAHAAHCVVLSTTLHDIAQLRPSSSTADNKNIKVQLHLARSLPEALHKARELETELRNDIVPDNGVDESMPPSISDITCWIAGGERVFDRVLHHPSCACLSLTVVDYHVDLLVAPGRSKNHVARFPAAHRWDHKYVQQSATHIATDALPFTQYWYKRQRVRSCLSCQQGY